MSAYIDKLLAHIFNLAPVVAAAAANFCPEDILQKCIAGLEKLDNLVKQLIGVLKQVQMSRAAPALCI